MSDTNYPEKSLFILSHPVVFEMINTVAWQSPGKSWPHQGWWLSLTAGKPAENITEGKTIMWMERARVEFSPFFVINSSTIVACLPDLLSASVPINYHWTQARKSCACLGKSVRSKCMWVVQGGGCIEVLILSLDAPCHAIVPCSRHWSCWLLINSANERNLSPTRRRLVVDMVSHWK